MSLFALILGLLTAGGGAYMAGILLRTGRPEADVVDSHLSSGAVFAHMTVAGLGVVMLGLFVVYDSSTLAWGALGLLVVAALIGGALFLVWTRDRHGDAETVAQNKRRLAEQQISSSVVHTHGALAFATLVLVLLLALGIGV